MTTWLDPLLPGGLFFIAVHKRIKSLKSVHNIVIVKPKQIRTDSNEDFCRKARREGSGFLPNQRFGETVHRGLLAKSKIWTAPQRRISRYIQLMNNAELWQKYR